MTLYTFSPLSDSVPRTNPESYPDPDPDFVWDPYAQTAPAPRFNYADFTELEEWAKEIELLGKAGTAVPSSQRSEWVHDAEHFGVRILFPSRRFRATDLLVDCPR